VKNTLIRVLPFIYQGVCSNPRSICISCIPTANTRDRIQYKLEMRWRKRLIFSQSKV